MRHQDTKWKEKSSGKNCRSNSEKLKNYNWVEEIILKNVHSIYEVKTKEMHRPFISGCPGFLSGLDCFPISQYHNIHREGYYSVFYADKTTILSLSQANDQ